MSRSPNAWQQAHADPVSLSRRRRAGKGHPIAIKDLVKIARQSREVPVLQCPTGWPAKLEAELVVTTRHVARGERQGREIVAVLKPPDKFFALSSLRLPKT